MGLTKNEGGVDVTQFQFRAAGDKFLRIEAPLEDYAIFAPRAQGTFEEYIVNQFPNGARVYPGARGGERAPGIRAVLAAGGGAAGAVLYLSRPRRRARAIGG